jgi:hypothetical protein
MSIQRVIEQAASIHIVSGEGDGPGTVEVYTGKRTIRAIKMRLTRERCGGDRWARAEYLRGNGLYDELPLDAL